MSERAEMDLHSPPEYLKGNSNGPFFEPESLYRETKRITNFLTKNDPLSYQDKEDIAHDSFILFLNAVQQGMVRTSFSGYLRSIIYHKKTEYFNELVRLKKDDNNKVEDLITEKPWHDIYDSIERLEIHGRCKLALGNLIEKDREILIRFYYQEQSAEQICEAMNLSYVQFRNAKHRAKDKLRKLMAHDGRKHIVF